MRTCHVGDEVLARAERAEGEPIFNPATFFSYKRDHFAAGRHGRVYGRAAELDDLAASAMREMLA